MNRTKTITSALLLMTLPFVSPAFASDREHGDRGRGHEYGESQHGHHGYSRHHHPHYRHHYYRHHDRHYRHHDGHHDRHYDSYRHAYRGHEKHTSVTLPFPPLPPFPVIIVKPHH